MSRLRLQEHVPLAPLTTIGLGGNARWYAECESVEVLKEAIEFSRREACSLFVLGGGSNVLISDSGFDGIIVRVVLRGIRKSEEKDSVCWTVAAGEIWDELVGATVAEGLGGIECLSGIPGLVGATPMQNVGAYGQEVRETILAVKALDRVTLEVKEFDNSECRFGYRESRFKLGDRDRYIITEVAYRLNRNQPPAVRYGELSKRLGSDARSMSGPAALDAVRRAVLDLRRKKSMVVDPTDPNSRSVGSFFTNPVLADEDFRAFSERLRTLHPAVEAPSFPAEGGVKIPAAWLIEQAGFRKGYRKGGTGISDNHSLAIVNRGGTAADVLALASEIESSVEKKFGIKLQREAIVVGRG